MNPPTGAIVCLDYQIARIGKCIFSFIPLDFCRVPAGNKYTVYYLDKLPRQFTKLFPCQPITILSFLYCTLQFR